MDALAALSLRRDIVDVILQQRHKLAGIVVPEGLPASTAAAVKKAIGGAFVSGFRQVMLISAAMALASALSAAVLLRPRPPADDKEGS
jgi:signal transduction protein with GAF and PtsI domain